MEAASLFIIKEELMKRIKKSAIIVNPTSIALQCNP
jgi:hypothetical protein